MVDYMDLDDLADMEDRCEALDDLTDELVAVVYLVSGVVFERHAEAAGVAAIVGAEVVPVAADEVGGDYV